MIWDSLYGNALSIILVWYTKKKVVPLDYIMASKALLVRCWSTHLRKNLCSKFIVVVSLKLPSKFAILGYNERRLALSISTSYVLCKNQYYLKSIRCNMVDVPLNDAVAAWQCDTILLPFTYSLTSRPNDHEKSFDSAKVNHSIIEKMIWKVSTRIWHLCRIPSIIGFS